MNTERTALIAHLIDGYVTFPDEAFEPRSITGEVIDKRTTLRPVAFKAHVNMIETMGGASFSGGMRPYIWLDDDNRLIGQVNDKYVPLDIETLSADDILNLEIGVQGNSNLLEEVFERACQEMFDEVS